MKNFSFRQFQRSSDSADAKQLEGDPKDKDSIAYRKRREQVRKAQRTHRDRKEAYIKSLEKEVLQRRTTEAKILQDQANLAAEIARLKRILDRNGLVYDASQGNLPPSSLDHLSAASSSGSVSSVGVVASPFHPQQLHVSSSGSQSQFFFSDASSDSSPGAIGTKLKQKHSFFRSRGRAESSEREGSNAEEPATLAPVKLLRDIDQTSLGMEFVLTLEAPCLHHTHPSTASLESTGHVLTATAPLLFQSPTQPVNTSTTKFPPWETPNLGLEKLLSLAANFELEDELTPVQAWQQIRSHPEFAGLEVRRLRELVQELGRGVKCYGFGAVIETDTLSDLLNNLFPSGGRDFSFGFDH